MSQKHPLKSRKFWLAIGTTIIILLNHLLGLQIDPEELIALISPILVWIMAEAGIDIARNRHQ